MEDCARARKLTGLEGRDESVAARASFMDFCKTVSDSTGHGAHWSVSLVIPWTSPMPARYALRALEGKVVEAVEVEKFAV